MPDPVDTPPTPPPAPARQVVLDTDFGSGEHFLARWQAWRQSPAPRPSLSFIAVAPQPPDKLALAQQGDDPLWGELFTELARQWPPLTPDLHSLDFEQGQVRLLLAVGPVDRWLSQLLATVDEFWLRGTAGGPPDWDPRHYKALGRLAAPLARAFVPHGTQAHLKALRTAGFEAVAGVGPLLQAQVPAGMDPRRRSPLPSGRRPAPQRRSAVVVGSGLAGACAARALAQQGLQVTVLEQHSTSAAEASGNVAGLFHGVAHAEDGAHARWLRAGALRTRQWLEAPVRSGVVAGQLSGLLRGADAGINPMAPPAWLQQQHLPPDYVHLLSPAQAESAAGCTVTQAAWFYPGGGWLHPPGMVAWCLAHPHIVLRTAQAVASIRHEPGAGWVAHDSTGKVLAQADILVLANAHGMHTLLPEAARELPWPWQRRRGQISQLSEAQSNGLKRPQHPLTSGGYLISLPDTLGGGLLCGATNQRDDNDPVCRGADHARNLSQITALTGQPVDLALAQEVTGRVAWRLAVDDKLPIVGPVPAGLQPGGHRREQPKHLPRIEGLYVLGALGSRGLSLAPLLGEVLAAWVCGTPMPVGADMLDAVDAARFVSRAVKKGR